MVLTYTQGMVPSGQIRLMLNRHEGRRLKAKLRLGCHQAKSSAARMSLARKERCLSLLWPRIETLYALF